MSFVQLLTTSSNLVPVSNCAMYSESYVFATQSHISDVCSRPAYKAEGSNVWVSLIEMTCQLDFRIIWLVAPQNSSDCCSEKKF